MKSVPKLYDIRSFGILAFRIRWTDFHNLYIEWKCFGCRWSIWTSFFTSQGMLPWQLILGKICQNDLHPTPWHFKTRCTIVLRINAFIATLIALHRVKMVKIGSVVFELSWGRKWKLCCDSTEIGLYRGISQQLLNQSLPTFQHW